mmetsp:Transcript_15135/g.15683  ORF Transcript_15135/g.15683 Transcript_15135/m.15683 type:complete len:272 (+) Transcript_15135:35-850(+)
MKQNSETPKKEKETTPSFTIKGSSNVSESYFREESKNCVEKKSVYPDYHADLRKQKSNTKSKKIAIYGGSFDPPTISHMVLACEIYNSFEHIDEVWIVPCGDGRKDKSLRCNAIHRINMLELIKQDLVYVDLPVFIDRTEYKNKQYMPTYDLLRKLQGDYPNYTFSFCLGSDLLKGLPKWEYGTNIINEFELIVLCRPGYKIEGVSFIDKCKVLETNYENSSTQVRQRIESVLEKKHKVHLGISGLTSRSVLRYIYENGLYMVESSCEEHI